MKTYRRSGSKAPRSLIFDRRRLVVSLTHRWL